MEDILGDLNNEGEIALVKRVLAAGQGHVFEFWPKLDAAGRKRLLSSLSKVDIELLGNLISKHILPQAPAKDTRILSPAKVIPIPRTPEENTLADQARLAGDEALKRGEVALLVVAGGQSSRLGYSSPKGMFPVTPIRHKTLFKLFAEKILAMNLRYSITLPWLIMTSLDTDAPTRGYFEDNAYFGLGKGNIIFFRQGMLPSLDLQGKLILKTEDEIFMNPDGHGGSIPALQSSGALSELERRGVKYIFFFNVDNPLLVMADPVLVGHHILKRAEMSSKSVVKANPEEKIGIFALLDGRMGIVEYSDLTREEMYAKDPTGNTLYNAGNINIHIFSLEFIRRLDNQGPNLPYHVARKKIKTFRGDIEGIKFETFVFDAYASAARYAIMEVRREENFAPVKNPEGVDSAISSRELQVSMFAGWLEAAGVVVPKKQGVVDGTIEISPAYALDKQEFLRKYHQKPNLLPGFELYLG